MEKVKEGRVIKILLLILVVMILGLITIESEVQAATKTVIGIAEARVSPSKNGYKIVNGKAIFKIEDCQFKFKYSDGTTGKLNDYYNIKQDMREKLRVINTSTELAWLKSNIITIQYYNKALNPTCKVTVTPRNYIMVTLKGNGGKINGSNTKNISAYTGGNITLSKPDKRSGYQFIGWKGSNGTIYEAKEYRNITWYKSITLTAQWKESYVKNIEAKLQSGKKGYTMNGINAQFDKEQFYYTITMNTGDVISGNYSKLSKEMQGKIKATPTTLKLNQSNTVTITYQNNRKPTCTVKVTPQNKITVTLDGNRGKIGGASTKNISAYTGGNLTLPEPDKRLGAKFIGWKGSNGTIYEAKTYKGITWNKDMKLTAQWVDSYVIDIKASIIRR